MPVLEMRLPDVGEGLAEADICRWLVAPGDPVELNQIVVEVETAKAVVELPSPFVGNVAELKFAVGDTAEVGAVLLTLTSASTDTTDVIAPASSEPADLVEVVAGDEPKVDVLVGYGPSSQRRRRARRAVEAPAATAVRSAPTTMPRSTEAPPNRAPDGAVATGSPSARRAKPKVRRLARDLGIDLAVVERVENGSFVTEADLVRHAGGAGGGGPTGPQRSRIQGVRKAIAAAVSRSAFTAPHVTVFLTVDVTETVELVAALRADPRFEGVRATSLLIAARAVCIAARENPDVNASWDEGAQEIVHHDAVNLGVAAATPRGLIVPNIKGADGMTLVELARALDELVAVARSGAATPRDMSGGTMTITNVGVFGVDAATPILNPGESAILGLGAIARRPWVVGDAVVPRSVMTLSLSFDHRLIDGELGSRFLTRVGAVLTDPLLEMTLS